MYQLTCQTMIKTAFENGRDTLNGYATVLPYSEQTCYSIQCVVNNERSSRLQWYSRGVC